MKQLEKLQAESTFGVDMSQFEAIESSLEKYAPTMPPLLQQQGYSYLCSQAVADHPSDFASHLFILYFWILHLPSRRTPRMSSGLCTRR